MASITRANLDTIEVEMRKMFFYQAYWLDAGTSLGLWAAWIADTVQLFVTYIYQVSIDGPAKSTARFTLLSNLYSYAPA